MPKTHPRYSAEFRAEAIRLVHTSGKSKTAIAQELGISLEALRAWVRQAELDAGERHDGLTSEEVVQSVGCGARTRSCGRNGRFW